MRKYPSGRRGSPAKGVGRQKRREGSNPSFRASKKRHPKGCLFLLLRLIFCAFPRENHPLTNPIKRFILIAIKKAVTKKKLFFRGQREGRPRLKAPRQGHGPYHFRAACDEQDGGFPLQKSRATAYAVSRVEPWSNAYYLTPDTIQGWGFLFIPPRSQGGTDYERSQQGKQGIYV